MGSDLGLLDAKLGPLQNNGGPTSTFVPLVGSPAIDAGNPAAPGSGGNACATTDQRGVVRPVGAACDMGATEAGGAILGVSSSSPTSLGQATFFTVTLTVNTATYQWNFGAGATGSGALVQHTYSVGGTYSVIVTATNNLNTLTATTVVNIVNPTLAITSLSPASVIAGSSAFTLTVRGVGFVNGSVIQWNNLSRPTTFINATQLTTSISAADVAKSATINVSVLNPGGGGATTPISLVVTPSVVLSHRFFLPLMMAPK